MESPSPFCILSLYDKRTGRYTVLSHTYLRTAQLQELLLSTYPRTYVPTDARRSIAPQNVGSAIAVAIP